MKKEIMSKDAPAAIGPYSQGISTPMYVFVSGQLPVEPSSGEMLAGIEAQTMQAMKNLKAVLKERGLSLDDVVKTTVFMQDLGDFQKMNEVYGTFFNAPYPARSTVQVAKLPKDALVEIECIAIKEIK